MVVVVRLWNPWPVSLPRLLLLIPVDRLLHWIPRDLRWIAVAVRLLPLPFPFVPGHASAVDYVDWLRCYSRHDAFPRLRTLLLRFTLIYLPAGPRRSPSRTPQSVWLPRGLIYGWTLPRFTAWPSSPLRPDRSPVPRVDAVALLISYAALPVGIPLPLPHRYGTGGRLAPCLYHGYICRLLPRGYVTVVAGYPIWCDYPGFTPFIAGWPRLDTLI